ncbi:MULTISPECIES: class I SAM-dependent methyltransferase [Mycobacteriaceae]|uniref:Phosphatidylethanolamine N-methyltransferase n=1 Tax=Mycolicibacterium neoaurum VKM Ac-1815D TaxID=700508 RepID=V5XGE2_MYCNE|nr:MULTISPECIES: class I SAM-dependent methyltransferase [Mycobacteriaceae]AHC26903.1 phosphatidylethanolamine N-methyltransferase [Mycolicibacterium neoaurum VKM Ac-1815D]AMO07189.1 phosphatidylethanolamine N-methyltransferase [Mycolicibacterium neoaurum]AXK74431.1 class I SAM-dependent methyltransferase [Mycolicibacterium neoaurum]KJQ50096.1 phosphatidylethanolamine N-methyltransferase [Mycolicibacterium neoaurum]KUM07044.1 phosphatidylethanolamine N-methyltransferase [Mycolicibacterium neoa
MTAAVDNPFFARLWLVTSGHEPESVRRLRVENLAGLRGRVLEVGAGTGTNFVHYPGAVSEVVALEPERKLAEVAREAAATAPVPVSVSTATIEEFEAGEPFDAVVCSLVLCSVDDPDGVLRQLFSMLKPGGELRYLEHVAGTGWRATLQRVADATIWPRLLGNCHTHRNTETAIADAGFTVAGSRREQSVPAWVPVPVSELAIGRAVRG